MRNSRTTRIALIAVIAVLLIVVVIVAVFGATGGFDKEGTPTLTPTNTPTPIPTITPTLTTTPTITPSLTPTPIATPSTKTTPTPTPTPTMTPILQGETIVITSISDSGPGTLRQALLDAQRGDTITFDPAVFSPSAPSTIYITRTLPPIGQGNLIIDASNAGVILDGSKLPGEEFASCLEIYSHGNMVRGLQIVNFFPGAGITIGGGARNNMIGGDRSIGAGPTGQGNLVSRGDIGIALSDNGTSFNTITGNLVGTDVSGKVNWGNTGSGVWIFEGASHNVIGPDNIAAFNKVYGIEIRSMGNTITQNSIHDNASGGMYIWEGMGWKISAPVLFDFDVSEGLVSGIAPADAAVEVFSDSSDQGRVYEGKIMANTAGQFTLIKGASFAGPRLTATATDTEGSTSIFSGPTIGNRRYAVLQEGNQLPKSLLITKPSNELEDNRIGSVGMSDMVSPSGHPHDLQTIMKEVVNIGLKHFRFTIVNIDYDLVDWDRSEFTFEPRHNDFLQSMAENGVMVKYILQFRDDALGGEGRPYHPRFKTEEEIQRYLDYVRFIIGNVKGYVPYFEIFNEPNIRDCVQWIEVEDYINLVKRVVPVIRQEYPEAKIALAGTTYLIEPESRDYLFSILRSDVMPLVDVVSWHPMYGASPEYDSDYYYEYPAIVQQIKDTASANGFKGEYEAGEISWWIGQEHGAGGWDILYSETASAKYNARSIVMHLGMAVRVTNNSIPSGLRSRQLVDSAIKNLCTVMAGAEPEDLTVEMETQAEKLRSYSFSLSNGDKLVALWTDGVAVDDDPGVKATVTLPDFSAKKVTAIDVLNGFEQELTAGMENGNLIIRNLLIKDYPIILCFAD